MAEVEPGSLRRGPELPAPRSVGLPDRGFGPITMAVHEAGPPEGVAVVFSHGFPELGYSWRYQVAALAEAGYRVLAPDQRGYGGTSAPDEIEAYDLGQLTGDLVDLLDASGVERAVFVGHDWGGLVAWAMPVLHPDRTLGVIGICTPYAPFPTTSLLSSLVDGDAERMYMLWFQEPGVAEEILDPIAPLVFETLMRGGIDPALAAARMVDAEGRFDMNPFRRITELEPTGQPVGSAAERAVYAETFSRTGFRGGINWYRNLDRNAERYPEVGKRHLDLPTLMICAEWDPALPPAFAAGMPALCSDLELHTVGRAGHWIQQEFPDATNTLLLDWLTRRFPSD